MAKQLCYKASIGIYINIIKKDYGNIINNLEHLAELIQQEFDIQENVLEQVYNYYEIKK